MSWGLQHQTLLGKNFNLSELRPASVLASTAVNTYDGLTLSWTFSDLVGGVGTPYFSTGPWPNSFDTADDGAHIQSSWNSSTGVFTVVFSGRNWSGSNDSMNLVVFGWYE